MMRLDNWYYFNGCISGEIYGNPKFEDGDRVLTSPVVEVDGWLARTRSGSEYILGTQYGASSAKPKLTLDELNDKIIEWGKSRGIFDKPDAKAQALKTVSELGEFADNIAKGRDPSDDIGDIVVTLIMQCHIQGISLRDCVEGAYREISKRKGKMVNGVFIKEEDVGV